MRHLILLPFRPAFLAIAMAVAVAVVSYDIPLPASDQVVLSIEKAPETGWLVTKVDLTAAAAWCRATPVVAGGIAGRMADGGSEVALQFVPDLDFDASKRVSGLLVARLPAGGGPFRVLLSFDRSPEAAPEWKGSVDSLGCVLRHDPRRLGGMPTGIRYRASGKVFENPSWNNRLHHRDQGSFLFAEDPEATVERIAAGPLVTTVRVRGRFLQGGKWPASKPEAIYDWHYFHDSPLVWVEATIRQREPFEWHEVHFLELDYPKEVFPEWAGGEPRRNGSFAGKLESFPLSEWGVVHDGHDSVGMFGCGQVLLYDGGPGTYIQAHGDEVWRPWNGLERKFSAWMHLGVGGTGSGDPVEAVAMAARSAVSTSGVTVGVSSVEERIALAEAGLATLSRDEVRSRRPSIRAARQLAARGRFEDASAALLGRRPSTWHPVTAGDLNLVLERNPGGISLIDLVDTAADRTLTSATPVPLFTIRLRNADSKVEVAVTADSGWSAVECKAAPEGGTELSWRGRIDMPVGDFGVRVRVSPDVKASALRFSMSVSPPTAPWSIWRVTFPGVAVADLGPKGCVLYPQGSGIVERAPWKRGFRYTGTYPSGWTTLQYLAAYDEEARTGLYLGVHDPWGSTKDLLVESHVREREVLLAFDHPVPDMGRPANRFEFPGEAVWQLVRGDWFDASVIYRDWVRREAKWYPRGSRTDTPEWMRELSVWALAGWEPNCVESVTEFAEYLRPPVAVHWYNWHEIPFDNDYPHYFPTKPGFAEGVKTLQSAGVHVMPYINGRLWDTRDRGAEDFEFTRVARPAVSKDEKGEPYTETYGSKESDGSPVRLGVMCPATALWQERVQGIVLRLMNECGVHAVYIDQIAAASPTLCFDPTHGHPLGGGHWWTEGYWKLLDELRRKMPPDRCITTECNGEPYIRCFDGYLTWHWQYDGQVAAFPAVYGGSVQMFGRSYGGGPTKDLALRMRAGQSLVFGEQLGWIAPGVVKEEGNNVFFRSLVDLRRRLAEYWHAGEMARPPRLEGDVPSVRADWQWGGERWVTTDAVLTGAWHQPRSKRLAMVFVNVSDKEVKAGVVVDLRPYGFSGESLRVRQIAPGGLGEAFDTPQELRRETTFAPVSAVAWEVTER